MVGLKQSYSDVLKMPTMERRFYLETLNNQNLKMREEADAQQNEEVVKTGKNTRTRKVSGGGVGNYSGQV